MKRQKTILLVEDNPDDEALALRALKKNNIGNKVVVVRDGVEALAFLLGTDINPGCPTDELPVLILLDLKLPRIDGLEVLRRIRAHERTQLLPVAILTSSREENDLVESYRSGANSYIRKPVDYDQFSESLSQLALYWMVINQPPPIVRT